ncbi:25008_t:CDS:2, partial [Dentiscutata erythropus]
PQKRIEFYINGESTGFMETKDIEFNEFPLKIGHSTLYADFQGQMRLDQFDLLHFFLSKEGEQIKKRMYKSLSIKDGLGPVNDRNRY